jgi:Flp pilus assembly secretin CpaC
VGSLRTARLAAPLVALLLPGVAGALGDRQVKVSIEFRQSGTDEQTDVQGATRIIIRDGSVTHGAGAIGADSRTTHVKRTSGIFTIVQDGGESTLNVATRVPIEDVQYYRSYASGAGYAVRGATFENVGTSLQVHADVLSDRQIRLRLVPRVSYFSATHAGAIDFTDAATELLVEDGKPVTIGGGTSESDELVRRILGYGSSRSQNESSIELRARIQ